jgi:hypothetical protein
MRELKRLKRRINRRWDYSRPARTAGSLSEEFNAAENTGARHGWILLAAGISGRLDRAGMGDFYPEE